VAKEHKLLRCSLTIWHCSFKSAIIHIKPF
jgi:hypothetical protein